MKAIWLTPFAVVLAAPPAIAYSAHREAVAEQQRLEHTLTQTRSQVQRLIDLRADAPAIHHAIYDDTSLITTVRAGLRAAGVPDASVRDISTRRRPTRDPNSTEASSIDVTLNPCSPHLLGLVEDLGPDAGVGGDAGREVEQLRNVDDALLTLALGKLALDEPRSLGFRAAGPQRGKNKPIIFPPPLQ